MSSRILIADNDGESRQLLAGWLATAGHDCTPTTTGEALTEVRRLEPDVALVGVRGADDGGMWVVRALRAQHEETAVIIVAMPPDFDIAVLANRLGVVDCLPGPPTREALVDAVRRAGLWREAVRVARVPADAYAEEMQDQRTQMQSALSRVEPEAAQAVLMALLEARSPDTHDHSRRVAHGAAALSRRMGVSPEDVTTIERAALLHDIGKMVLPAGLLLDTRTLSPSEVAMLREHVTIGADLLRSVPSLAPLAPIVAATHERMDGLGYPFGLVGDAIPYEARIIAIADAFDALTAVRSYREPLSRPEAEAELVRAAGGHLDPLIVRTWLGMGEAVRCS